MEECLADSTWPGSQSVYTDLTNVHNMGITVLMCRAIASGFSRMFFAVIVGSSDYCQHQLLFYTCISTVTGAQQMPLNYIRKCIFCVCVVCWYVKRKNVIYFRFSVTCFIKCLAVVVL